MSKQSALIGWPKYDPKRYRFSMPNTVWVYKLKPVEFVIFSCLCYWQSRGRLTAETVAEGIHLSAATVKKYLSAMVSKGLVTGELNLAADLQRKSSEKFFTLPNEVFLLRLPPTAFVVYAYLLLIEDRRTHTCHPSYNTIAAATGVAKNTALKSISVLEEMDLITVEPSSYLDKRGMKWKGNNLYTILPVRIAVDKFNQHQLCLLELDTKRQQLREQQEKYERQHHRAALCAPMVAKGADYSAMVNVLGRMSGVQRYEHHTPNNFRNYWQYLDYFAVSAEIPENYLAPLEFIQPVVSEVEQLSSDREKVKYLNDYLCTLLAYERKSTAGVTRTFAPHTGELEAACGSYAKAFKFLC